MLRPSGALAGAPPRLTRPSAVPAGAVLDVLRGSGQPLAARVREEMEARLGADFSDVRLHTGPAARASAAGIGARAYTSGSHIVLGDGTADKHILAHELAHVIQQREGPVAGTDHAGGLKISSPGDRFEQQADTSARRALSGPVPGRTAPVAPQPQASSNPLFPHFTASRAVQRQSSGDGQAGPELLALIEELEVAIAVANELAAASGSKPPTAELNERLKPLREIAHGTDEMAKVEALTAVRAELGQAGQPLTTGELAQRRTVQRNGLLIGAVVGTLAVAGLGVLAWRIYKYIRERQERAQRERDQREQARQLREREQLEREQLERDLRENPVLKAVIEANPAVKDRLLKDPGRKEDVLINPELYKDPVYTDRYLPAEFGGEKLPEASIPAALTAGIADLGSDADKADRLFQNVNTFPFRYLGAMVSPVLAMHMNRPAGDCQTLVGIYLYVAQASGIKNVDAGIRRGRLLVDARPIHGRGTLGNTEDETHWYFKEHYWAKAAGKVYDLLFMVSDLVPVHAETGSDVHKGVTYYKFGPGLEVIEPEEGSEVVEGQGKVFTSHDDTIRFLDDRRILVAGHWQWK